MKGNIEKNTGGVMIASCHAIDSGFGFESGYLVIAQGTDTFTTVTNLQRKHTAKPAEQQSTQYLLVKY